MTRTRTISLVTVGDPARSTGGYLYHRRLAEAAPSHGARIDFVSLPDRPFPLAALDAPRRLAGDLGDVLVVDSIAAAFLGPWLARRSPSPPLVGSLHQPPGGIDHGRFRRRVQAGLDLRTWRRARVLIVASEDLADQVARAGLSRDRLRVVPPGRDVAEGAPAGPPVDLRAGRRAALLCAGNWVARKGILDLLDCFSHLPEPLATLHLVGDPGAEPRYGHRVRARLRSRDLTGRVVVHGVVPTSRMAQLYASADVFVLASTREPYGTVYGEAMAEGLPVVGWRAGNLPHLADHDREGLLVTPGDDEGLTAALATLAEDEERRRRLGEAARRRAGGRPTWSETAARFFAAVEEAVEA